MIISTMQVLYVIVCVYIFDVDLYASKGLKIHPHVCSINLAIAYRLYIEV